MPISKELLREAIALISKVERLHMDVAALVEDTIMLSRSFPDEGDFKAACVSTCGAFRLLIDEAVTPSELKYGFSGWKSYHYQHRVGQGVKALCRIMYRKVDGGIEVKGFGHRHVPGDFYDRMSAYRSSLN